jgi:hypothetical protein
LRKGISRKQFIPRLSVVATIREFTWENLPASLEEIAQWAFDRGLHLPIPEDTQDGHVAVVAGSRAPKPHALDCSCALDLCDGDYRFCLDIDTGKLLAVTVQDLARRMLRLQFQSSPLYLSLQLNFWG